MLDKKKALWRGQNLARKIKKEKRLCRMLAAVVVIFGVCWLPLKIVTISSRISKSFVAWPLSLYLFFGVHIVAVSSVMYNPILYGWLNENFKSEYKKMMPNCLAKLLPRERSTICEISSKFQKRTRYRQEGSWNEENRLLGPNFWRQIN